MGSAIFVYVPPVSGKTGFDAALKAAGVAFTIKALKVFTFADKTQLLAAARLFASRLEEGRVSRHRIASSKQEIAALQQEIEAGRAKEAPPTVGLSGRAARRPSTAGM